MKKIRYVIALGALLLAACSPNEPKMYSGDSKIQFNNLVDTVARHSFYFQETSITQDTLFFTVTTIGYTSKEERAFKVRPVKIENVVNAEEGIHYKSFTDPDILKWCVIKPGKVSARVPIVIMRNALADRTTYELQLELVENEHFVFGEDDKLWRRAIFSKDLLRPSKWTNHSETYYWGKYSYNKHIWMINQTNKRWDDEFFAELEQEPGSVQFWKDKLNFLLKAYKADKNNPPLLDDKDQEINGFPN